MKSVKTSTFWFPECWLMKTLTPFSAIAAGVAEMLKPNPGDVETMTTTSEEMLKPNRGETIDDDDEEVDVQVDVQGDVEAQVDLLPRG